MVKARSDSSAEHFGFVWLCEQAVWALGLVRPLLAGPGNTGYLGCLLRGRALETTHLPKAWAMGVHSLVPMSRPRRSQWNTPKKFFSCGAGVLPVSPEAAFRGSLGLTLGFLPGIQRAQPQCLPCGWSWQGQAGVETETLREAGPVTSGFPPLQCRTVPGAVRPEVPGGASSGKPCPTLNDY